MSNLIRALDRFTQNPIEDVVAFYSKSKNRANSTGDALESYVQDLFAGSVDAASEQDRNALIGKAFSYSGNQNNPPDLIIRGGDAIEVKKIESAKSGLALNSSYPKDKLHIDDPRINAACKVCEKWTEKDIIYTIGWVKDNKLKHLWFVYGDCYAAERSIYQKIAAGISSGILTIADIGFSHTKELGRVNKVDPLGITALRIRGMWHIDNPTSVYEYLYQPPDGVLGLACLMRKTKFDSFSDEDQALINNNEKLLTSNVKIKDPNNPANLVGAVLIKYKGLK